MQNYLYPFGQSLYSAITSPLSTISNLKNSMTISKPAFTRGAGFWSTPSDEQIKSIFGALTDINSQREDWYTVTPFIAEFLCTISNVGFIYVGLKHKSPELLFAGVASAISHSIPKQWLLTVDKIGVLVVASKLIREYQVIIDHPWLLLPVALAAIINFSDAYLARQHGYTYPHVIWHLSSAFMANIFLNYVK